MTQSQSQSIKTRVMDFVTANGGTATFTQIQKFIVEKIYGWEYNREDHRGWHTTSFRPMSARASAYYGPGYFLKPGFEKRYFVKTKNGYIVQK